MIFSEDKIDFFYCIEGIKNFFRNIATKYFIFKLTIRPFFEQYFSISKSKYIHIRHFDIFSELKILIRLT